MDYRSFANTPVCVGDVGVAYGEGTIKHAEFVDFIADLSRYRVEAAESVV